jgi:hypothetical protein
VPSNTTNTTSTACQNVTNTSVQDLCEVFKNTFQAPLIDQALKSLFAQLQISFSNGISNADLNSILDVVKQNLLNASGSTATSINIIDRIGDLLTDLSNAQSITAQTATNSFQIVDSLLDASANIINVAQAARNSSAKYRTSF